MEICLSAWRITQTEKRLSSFDQIENIKKPCMIRVNTYSVIMLRSSDLKIFWRSRMTEAAISNERGVFIQRSFRSASRYHGWVLTEQYTYIKGVPE